MRNVKKVKDPMRGSTEQLKHKQTLQRLPPNLFSPRLFDMKKRGNSTARTCAVHEAERVTQLTRSPPPSRSVGCIHVRFEPPARVLGIPMESLTKRKTWVAERRPGGKKSKAFWRVGTSKRNTPRVIPFGGILPPPVRPSEGGPRGYRMRPRGWGGIGGGGGGGGAVGAPEVRGGGPAAGPAGPSGEGG